MPRPPVLPELNWSEVFDAGLPFEDWMAEGESVENRQEIQKLIDTQPLDPEELAFLGSLPRPVQVVAIAEDWCGDVVRHVPVLEKLARSSKKIETRYVSREQHPEVFVRFLTNGGEAIPRFIFLNDRFLECGNWGPMPEVCRHLIARGKACGDIPAARRKVSALYSADPAKREVVRELLDLVATAVAAEP